jgi:cell wall-associated NlpC family hydrolase
MSEAEQRARVVEIANSFLGVHWIHLGRAQGGMDCGGLVIVTFKEAGLIPQDFDTEFYPVDFMMHRDEQKMVGFVERFCRKVEREPRPGDIALYRVGRVVAHCAIVVAWPRIIHAARAAGGVGYEDADQGEFPGRYRGVWSYHGWS